MKAIKKNFPKIIEVICILLFTWFIFSYLNVLIHNAGPSDYVYPKWNLFVILVDYLPHL